MELLHDAHPLLDRVSGARIRHELERILQEDDPERSLIRLTDLHALQRLHPELIADGWVADRYAILRQERAESDGGSVLRQSRLITCIGGCSSSVSRPRRTISSPKG